MKKRNIRQTQEDHLMIESICCTYLMDELFVKLVHEHHNDGQLLQAFQGQYGLRDEVVRDGLLVLRHRLLLGRYLRHGERLTQDSL